MTMTETTSTSQSELEKLVTDLRGLLHSKDLDTIPEIKLLRQRLDDGMTNVRDSAVRAAQEAARQAKEAAYAADRYAHDEPHAYAAGETYLPDGMAEPGWYQPVARGLEIKIGEKLALLKTWDDEANKKIGKE